MRNGLHLRTSSHLGARNVGREVLVFLCAMPNIAVGFSIRNVPNSVTVRSRSGGFVTCACWSRVELSETRRVGSGQIERLHHRLVSEQAWLEVPYVSEQGGSYFS